VSSELLYKSNRPRFLWFKGMINHLGCWKNTRRIRKSRAAAHILKLQKSFEGHWEIVLVIKHDRNLPIVTDCCKSGRGAVCEKRHSGP